MLSFKDLQGVQDSKGFKELKKFKLFKEFKGFCLICMYFPITRTLGCCCVLLAILLSLCTGILRLGGHLT
jgi:hypothetical protein